MLQQLLLMNWETSELQRKDRGFGERTFIYMINNFFLYWKIFTLGGQFVQVNDDLYLLTTRLPVHGLFFTVDCGWLCCLTYVIVWTSRVKASFNYLSILISKVGKQSSFFFFFGCVVCVCFCVCAVPLMISFFIISKLK